MALGQLPVLPYCFQENMDHLPVKKCIGVIHICPNFFLCNKNNMVMTVVNYSNILTFLRIATAF